MKSIAVINRSAPYGTANGQEALDLVLAMGSFGQAVSVFFEHDGVFQLLQGQDAAAIEHRQYSKTFAALEFYDIENIFVCEDSLKRRNLTSEQLCVAVTALDAKAYWAQLKQHTCVMTF